MSSLDAPDGASTTVVREQVRQLYEDHPYPPPTTDLREFSEHRQMRSGSPQHFFHQYWPCRAFREDLEVLVAGCGTSQAVEIAAPQPSLTVTGIDVSRASLDRTRAAIETHGLRNVTLHELPLERIGELDKRFDLILCTGVLHHLTDPDAGLRALRDVLAPDGAMHIGVYAAYGRTGVYMMQEYCRRLGVDPTDPELQDLSAVVDLLPEHHPLAIFARQTDDLAHPASLVDALLHPQDRAFTVPQIYAWLERCGMSFMRWQHQAPYLPHCGWPSATPHRTRLCALTPPEQHAAVELFRGTMIRHAFMTCRDDRPAESSVIDFSGDDWPSFVPYRFEGSEAVQKDLPDDVAAILRNTAHESPDLFVPLDEARLRVCNRIDGNRSIREIARSADLDNDPAEVETFARGFFELLWRYDLVQIRK